MTDPAATVWNGIVVRTWLESRVVAARSDQVAAERGGRELQDDCDKASAEEMVCSIVRDERSTATSEAFVAELRTLLDRDEYIWRGVYNDARFDRHVRSYLRKLVKMAKANHGFGNITHYQ